MTDLIVQPQGAEGAVRLTLLDEGWRLKAELLVEEEERIYVVMAFSTEAGWKMTELIEIEQAWCDRLHPVIAERDEQMPEAEFKSLVHRLVWYFGPLVLGEHTNLLNKLFEEYRGRLSRQLKQMEKSKSPEIVEKIREVSLTLALVEGMRQWR